MSGIPITVAWMYRFQCLECQFHRFFSHHYYIQPKASDILTFDFAPSYNFHFDRASFRNHFCQIFRGLDVDRKTIVGRLISFYEGLFSGAMLVFRGVLLYVDPGWSLSQEGDPIVIIVIQNARSCFCFTQVIPLDSIHFQSIDMDLPWFAKLLWSNRVLDSTTIYHCIRNDRIERTIIHRRIYIYICIYTWRWYLT